MSDILDTIDGALDQWGDAMRWVPPDARTVPPADVMPRAELAAYTITTSDLQRMVTAFWQVETVVNDWAKVMARAARQMMAQLRRLGWPVSALAQERRRRELSAMRAAYHHRARRRRHR